MIVQRAYDLTPQKAHPTTLEKLSEMPQSFWKTRVIEPKKNGLRCLIIEGLPYSYNMKPIYNMDHILLAVREHFGKRWLSKNILDGECAGKDLEESISLGKASVTKKPNDKLKYYIFDAIPFNGYRDRVYYDIPWEKRRSELNQLQHTFSSIIQLERRGVDSFEECEKYYDLLVSKGEEGIVIKDINAPYYFKRHKSWLKLKHKTTYDVEIVGFSEGKGKYVGTLGSLLVSLNGAITRCSGMDDATRDIIWENKSRYIGSIVEVECLRVSAKGKMRECQFKRFREDK